MDSSRFFIILLKMKTINMNTGMNTKMNLNRTVKVKAAVTALWSLWSLLLLLLAHVLSVVGAQRGEGGGGGGSANQNRRSGKQLPVRIALEAWANSLSPDKDFNVTMWAITAHSRSPSDYFDKYAGRISTVFQNNQANVNFVSVGACDGITDPIIKNRFLKNDHWRAVFIEPMTPNVRDLRTFIEQHGATNRSLVIQAAATSECTEPTIKVERPLYEERNTENKTIPHWLRRQIGSIVPSHRDHARPDWTLEEVRCVTASDILDDWTAAQNKLESQIKKRGPKTRRMRPHVLKIDVEGHDYEVLMGFLLDEIPVQDLPLIIEFEAKSIAKKYSAAKEHMEKR
jgi:FkbM family methyltransferase